jgi:putative ABC transport system permease protein
MSNRPDPWRGLRRVFRLPLGQRAVRGAVTEEIGFHLEERVEELMATGLTRAEAEREASARFGDLPRIGAELERIDHRMARRRSVAESFEAMRREARNAFRSLGKSPGFTTVAVLTLGLGIGANTAIFSVVDGVLLRPAPIADIGRLAMIWETDRKSGTTREPASIPDYLDFQRRTARFSRLAAFTTAELNLTVENGDPSRLAALAVSHEFFPMVGLQPIRGRTFSEEEDRPGGPPVALIGEALWEQLFSRDPQAIGRVIRLNDLSYTVVGVMPGSADFGALQILGAAAYSRGFADRGGRRRVDLWIPLRPDPAAPRGNHPIFVVGRLGGGTSVAVAQEEMTSVAADLEQTYRADNDGRGVFVEGLSPVIFGPVKPALLILLGAVALVLLVACANVANLLLARGMSRMREVTVRAALGASARRLALQFLTESAVLTAVGALLGVVLAIGGLRVLVALAPADIPRLGTVGIDGRVLGVALAMSVGVGLLFGLLPLLQARRQNIQASLQGESGRGGSASRHHRRLRSALVVSELTLAVMLMVGAGLLIKSLGRLQQVDPGFRAEGVLKAEYELPLTRYPRNFAVWPRWVEVQRFTDELRRRVTALPGVEAVTIAGSHPLDAGFTSSIQVVGREAEAADWPEPSIRAIDRGYLTTLRVALLSGRNFEALDDASAPPVILINAAAGGRFFEGRDPLGARVRLWGQERTVVGVVGDERIHGLAQATPPAIYLPTTQAPATGGSLLARGQGDPVTLAPAVRAVVRALDPALPLFGVEPLSETLSHSVGQRRFTMLVLGVFAAVALLLAIIGVHGVLSYTVAQRTREIGIRMALGADRSNVRGLVVTQGARLAALGLTLGLLGALAVSRALSTLLYGVGATDPATFAEVALVLGAVALVASYLPARRATRVSPVEALREE